MTVQNESIPSIYPKLPPVEGARPDPQVGTAAKVEDLASGAFEPSAPPRELLDEPSAPPFELLDEPSAPNQYAFTIPQTYTQANVGLIDTMNVNRSDDPNHISNQNPLTRLAEEPATPLADQVLEAAGQAAGAVKDAAPAVLNAAGTAAAAVSSAAAPVAGFAWSALKGAGNFVMGAVFAPPVDPEVLRLRRTYEGRIQVLRAEYSQLENEQWENGFREMVTAFTPALTGLLFAGVPGVIVGGLMGFGAVECCRAASRSFGMYQNKAARANQIRAEVRSLSALLGNREPRLRLLFQ